MLLSKTEPVSVVMCTYNGGKFVDEQVESIVNQDYEDLNLTIVDDASTDDTWQKLQRWQNCSRRVTLYKNEVNLGYNKNFERAIRLAPGRLIAISDQDDIWLPSKISKQVEAIAPADVMLSHSRSVRLEKGRLRFKSASQHHHFKGNDARRLMMFNQVNGHDMLFKKELVEKCLPIPPGMMYDWWIAINATLLGKIASVNEYLVYHRIHETNSYFSTNNTAKTTQLDLPQVLELFATLQYIKPEQREFLNEFLTLLRQHEGRPSGSFDVRLFRFLLFHGNIIFGHKKRLIPQLNYLKSAIKFARFTFKNKGIV